jgi:putative FmdB family regulatory protein
VPLYEYQCEACGNRFEKIQKFSDPPVDTCPSCGGRVRKLVSSPAFQFKGTGWYATDYARSGQKASGADSNDGTADAAKGATSVEKPDKPEQPSDKGTTTESAPAAKSDVKPST